MGLTIAEITMDVEEKYDIRFPEVGWENISTVKDFCILTARLHGNVKDMALYYDEIIIIFNDRTGKYIGLDCLLNEIT